MSAIFIRNRYIFFIFSFFNSLILIVLIFNQNFQFSVKLLVITHATVNFGTIHYMGSREVLAGTGLSIPPPLGIEGRPILSIGD